jgi:hypothetical protein
MTEDDVLNLLRDRVVAADGGGEQLCREWGLSKGHVGKILGGHLPLGDKVCRKLGIKRTVVVMYERSGK